MSFFRRRTHSARTPPMRLQRETMRNMCTYKCNGREYASMHMHICTRTKSCSSPCRSQPATKQCECIKYIMNRNLIECAMRRARALRGLASGRVLCAKAFSMLREECVCRSQVLTHMERTTYERERSSVGARLHGHLCFARHTFSCTSSASSSSLQSTRLFPICALRGHTSMHFPPPAVCNYDN